MKATIKFELPEDNYEYNLVNNAGGMHSVLWDMDQWLRVKIKFAPDSINDITLAAYQECRDQLQQLLDEENINLDT
tara:strand:- start:902 stop:1129 length:228 start_codon:yes stop_codon:yes gene_type:complete